MSVIEVDGARYPINQVRFFGTEKMALDQSFTLKDSAGSAIDLTDATFNFVLGDSITEATSGVTITGGGSAGTITVSITDAAMAGIVAGVYEYGLSYTVFGRTFLVAAGTYTARASCL